MYKQHSKHSTYVAFFNCYKNPEVDYIISYIFQIGNWGMERLRNLPKSPHPVRDVADTEPDSLTLFTLLLVEQDLFYHKPESNVLLFPTF